MMQPILWSVKRHQAWLGKDQIVSTIGFEGHVISMAITQLCLQHKVVTGDI